MSSLDFTGKSVVVVGGSGGIGHAIARGFERAGATVTITGTRRKSEYASDFSGLDFRTLDLADADATEAFAASLDKVDVLVNAAGLVVYKSREFEPETFRHVLDVNVSAGMRLLTLVKPLLSETRGCIVNTSSVVAGFATTGNPAYGASKAAITHMTRTLAVRWAGEGIRVNAIAPGFVPTKMTAVSHENEKISDAIVTRTPMGRWGKSEDMVGPTLFLASELAAFITGQTLIIDGGYSLVL